MGEGAGESRPSGRREPPFPAAPIQQPREEAVAPAVKDAFRPPGGREPPLRHTTHRLLDYVPLDVTRDAAHGGALEGRAPPAQSPAVTGSGALQATRRYYNQLEGTAGQYMGGGEGREEKGTREGGGQGGRGGEGKGKVGEGQDHQPSTKQQTPKTRRGRRRGVTQTREVEEGRGEVGEGQRGAPAARAPPQQGDRGQREDSRVSQEKGARGP